MRALRTTRNIRTLKAKQPVLGTTITTSENVIFSLFEDFTPETVKMENNEIKCKRSDAPTDTKFTIFEIYNGADIGDADKGYSNDGLIAIDKFRNAVIKKRMDYLQAIPNDTNVKKFNLCLLVNEETNTENVKSYQVVSLDFIYTPKEGEYQETANISVFNEVGEGETSIPRRIKNLVIDSDQTEAVLRFVKDFEWHSTTYAILDFNKNLNIDKSVHLVLDTPFNCNMNWFAPNRRLVYGYCIYEPQN